ncbi:LEA type 2 family protein [Halorarum salinum]|uniref:LEA type 2 family protein n=1 Tax=Halorarum salinum TaxID=2743089 RepID=A0A7D5LA31_9EURY|nr:LEA type 2 family protein [Halobaculum salinum]QLG61692.1 LEA type 2 family protein [Halobaculum salinum]
MVDTRGAISTVKVVAVAAVVLVGSVGGAVALGVVGAPSVESVENRFGEVTDETTEIRTDMVVNNPNPIGIRLGGTTVSYTVRMNDVRMAEGSKEGVGVETGNSTLEFRTGMNNSKIPAWWVSHVSNDEHTTLRVDADVHSSLLDRTFGAPQVERDVDTSVIEAFRSEEPRPVEVDSAAVTNPVMVLERTEASWGTVDEGTTEVRMTLYLHNPKPYPITLSEVGYDITMNDVAVGDGEAGRTTTIPPGETVPVEATTTIDTQRLDEWWVSHLDRNQVTDLRLDLYLVIDLSEAGAGERRVDLDEFNETVETDVFGTKNRSADGTTGGGDDDDASDGDGTDDGTEAPDGDGTDAPTDGGTATPTPTATPDGGTTTTEDDGGLF